MDVKTRPFRLTGIHVRNIAAIRKADYIALRRGMDALKRRRDASAGCRSTLNCIDLSEAVVFASVYAANHCPEWLKSGDVMRFPTGTRPFALYLYALYLNSTRQQSRMLGVTETALAMVPKHGFNVAELYLRIMRVNAYVIMDNRRRARELIEQALEIALPYGLLSPFSEHLGTMRGVLEEVSRERFPRAHKQILKGWKEVLIVLLHECA